MPANVDILLQQISPTLSVLHLWPHHAGKHGHPFPVDQSYIINRSSLATVCRQTRSCFPNRSAVHYKSSLATLCRQTQSCFPKISVLHFKSFISCHILPANILPQQINPILLILYLWPHYASQHGHTPPTAHRSSSVATLCLCRQTWLYIPQRFVAPQELCYVLLVKCDSSYLPTAL
jgi:hypothetical protein